jgi:hypothetical protein
MQEGFVSAATAWTRVCGLSMAGLLLVGALGAQARAATFGVPTALDATGGRTGASANPPGYLTIQGPSALFTRGDTVHQMRLFIEVTGTTLDIRVFDPGTAASTLDETYNGVADGSTTYSLRNPVGTVIATVTIGADTAATDNRLVRFRNGSFCVLGSAGCTAFTGLAPGLYELRITETAGDDTNTLGVDIRDAAGNPYAAYTTAFSDGTTTGIQPTETSALVGVMAGALISPPMVLYPLVDRGCGLDTSNFDSDGAASASLTDAQGVTTALALSGPTGTHSETPVTIDNPAVTNLESDNYGLYTLRNDPGPTANLVDWRFADFTGWANNPANLPRNPNGALRVYLPNDDTGALAPAQPVLQSFGRVDGGANPPVAGQPTRFLVSGVLQNPTGQALTNVTINLGGFPVGITTFLAVEALVDGVPTTCSPLVTGARFQRCTFATSLPAGSVATLRVLAQITPAGSGTLALTGAPTLGVDNQVRADYTSAFATTERRGPLCSLSAQVGAAAPPLLATRATIRGLRVDASAGVVEFVTGIQRDTVGFRLYAARDRSLRGPLVPLTAGPVPAPVATSMTPTFYRVSTRAIVEPFLVVEEEDTRGRRRAAGPFAVGDPALRAALERLQWRHERFARRGSGGGRAVALTGLSDEVSRRAARHERRRWRPREDGAAAVAGLKVLVRGQGPVEVPLDRLRTAGMPRRAIARLRLSAQGRPVAYEFVPSPSGPALRFEAERLATDYTDENAYLLTWGGGEPPPLRVALSRSGDPRRPGFERVEKQRYYSVDMPLGEDPFVWEILTSLDGPWPYDFDPEAGDFDLPGLEPADGDVPVRLRFHGSSRHRHRVSARLNGAALGEVEIDGRAAATLDAVVPGAALRETGNRFELGYETVGAPAGERGMLYLDHLELGVALRHEGPVEWEITAFAPELPPLRGASYLILTHERFSAAARRLASLKASEGQRPLVVDVERAYDRYAAGVAEARAIPALLRELASRAPLRAVVLLGDDSLDPLDHLGFGASAFVPSLVAWDGELGRVPSENLFADLDDDGRPDLSIGRLPAGDEEQAEALVEKVARQRTALRALSGRFLMVADNQGPSDAPFLLEAQAAASRLPAGSAVAWSDVASGVGEARAALARGLAEGAALTQYFGHAGEYVWADERLLGVEDVETLAATSQETVVFTWTCEAQVFNGVFGPTVNEALLLAPRGGALAAFGPSGISDPALQRELQARLNELFVRRRLPLGEAVRRAKAEALAARPEMRPVVEGFNLLGDPSLRLE